MDQAWRQELKIFMRGGRRAIKDHLKCLLKFFSSLFVVLICQEGLPICLRAHKSTMNMLTLGSFFSFLLGTASVFEYVEKKLGVYYN